MDEKLSQQELQNRLDAAAAQVSVEAQYRHYKGGMYKVLQLAILENNNDICVVYEALYGNHLPFIRPVDVWMQQVDVGGKTMQRFTKVKQG